MIIKVSDENHRKLVIKAPEFNDTKSNGISDKWFKRLKGKD